MVGGAQASTAASVGHLFYVCGNMEESYCASTLGCSEQNRPQDGPLNHTSHYVPARAWSRLKGVKGGYYDALFVKKLRVVSDHDCRGLQRHHSEMCSSSPRWCMSENMYRFVSDMLFCTNAGLAVRP